MHSWVEVASFTAIFREAEQRSLWSSSSFAREQGQSNENPRERRIVMTLRMRTAVYESGPEGALVHRKPSR